MQRESLFQKISSSFKRPSPVRVFLVFLLLGLIAYANAVNHPFVHDDIVFIQDNPYIKQINLAEIFFFTSSSDGPKSITNTYWRPLLELVYRLEYKIFGLHPAGYHFINVLIHIINAFLIYRFLILILNDKRLLALAVSILFLIHPVQNEAVACVSGISNLLFAFLTLSSLLLYVKGRPGHRIDLFLGSLFLFVLALLTKEQAVILPFLIIFYELFFPDREIRVSKIRISCYFIVLLFYLLFRTYYIGSLLSYSMENRTELALRILAIPQTLLMYLRILILPYGLHYYRSTDILEPFLIPVIVLLVVAAIVVFIINKATGTRKKIMIFSCFWFFLFWLPTSNILPLINEYSLILSAEHFMYLPMVGVALFVLSFLEPWAREYPRRAVVIFTGVCLIFLPMTIKQNTYWRGEIPLFKRTLKYEKDFGRAHFLLAGAYFYNGEYERAIAQYQKAYDIMSDYVQKTQYAPSKKFYRNYLKMINFNVGQSFAALGKYDKANQHYHDALAIEPKDVALLNNIAINYVKMGRKEEASRYFKRIMRIEPGNVTARNNLATLYVLMDRKEEALKLYRQILNKQPDNQVAYQNYQRLLSELNEQ